MAIIQWKAKAERAQRALVRLREATKGAAIHVRHDGEAIAAAAIAGAVRGSFEASGKDYSLPNPAGGKLPPELPLGLLLLGIAYSGQTDVSDDFHAAGSGVLAYSAGREAELFMKARGALKPGEAQ